MALIWEVVPNEWFPRIEEQIVLGHDGPKTMAWLEFKSTSFLIDRSYRPGVFKTVIGAAKSGNSWNSITTAQIAKAKDCKRVSLVDAFTDPTRAFGFQKAVVDQWQNFSSARASEFAKGTTFGKSMTSPSFVAKALKTGFDAIGQHVGAYSGFKASDWSVDDLLAYQRKRAGGLVDPGLIGFEKLAPDERFESGPGEPRDQEDDRRLKYIPSVRAKGHSGTFAYARDLEFVKEFGFNYERVIGYGFRGDTRSPGDIKGAGGFLPNYTRVDHNAQLEAKLAKGLEEYYALRKDPKNYGVLKTWVEKDGGEWNLYRIVRNPKFRKFIDADWIDGLYAARRSPKCPTLAEWFKLNSGALDLESFIVDQHFRGFVSTTKSICVAKAFATGLTATPGPGWIYACFVEGAFDFGLQDEHKWLTHQEQELCMPGMLDWEDVVACRHVLANGTFDGAVWMRKTFLHSDLQAATDVLELLSNKQHSI